MPSRVRFGSARSVYDAFADLRLVMTPPGDDVAPLDHARALLASKRPGDAILFLAHVLPRREAVWWAIQCVRALLGRKAEGAALASAETWVRASEDENRRAALAAAYAGAPGTASTMLAFAAGWSGGSIAAPDQPPAQPPASACAMAVNAAVMMAVTASDPRNIPERIRACADAGLRFADGGDAAVAVDSSIA